MQSIADKDFAGRTPILGFGCSAVMGRVGRKASLAALEAAYDEDVLFYDTARSYGYGESEALLGEFLRGRRDRLLVSTKFGILPAPDHPLKRTLKPVARALLQLVPGARKAIGGQLARMSSAGHFSVAALQQSLDASLHALRTDYVDFLFLHEPPLSVIHREDLFEALQRLVAAGKVRRLGIASSRAVIDAAIEARIPGLKSMQFPCNLLDLKRPGQESTTSEEIVWIVNHPFGGPTGIAAAKALLTSLAHAPQTPAHVREKLQPMDDELLADVVLNAITFDTGVQVVVPSMLRLDHVRANVTAIKRSRFSSEEIQWLRVAITATNRC
jgi:aryl-alcohol dehydrogenase-like predicted oxidoreductase